MHSKPGECTPAPKVFPKGICEPDRDRAHISVPPPTSGRFASKVITAEENGVFQVARRRCGDAVGGLPLGKC